MAGGLVSSLAFLGAETSLTGLFFFSRFLGLMLGRSVSFFAELPRDCGVTALLAREAVWIEAGFTLGKRMT